MGKRKRLMAERLKEAKKVTAVAKLNDVPTSPRKMRLVADTVRGVEVNRALDLLRNNPAVELLAFEMQVVRRALQSITGEISSEDILQSIFAGFCIGK